MQLPNLPIGGLVQLENFILCSISQLVYCFSRLMKSVLLSQKWRVLEEMQNYLNIYTSLNTLNISIYCLNSHDDNCCLRYNGDCNDHSRCLNNSFVFPTLQKLALPIVQACILALPSLCNHDAANKRRRKRISVCLLHYELAYGWLYSVAYNNMFAYL